MDPFTLFIEYEKQVAEAKLKIIHRMEGTQKDSTNQRTSKMNAIINVLQSADKPLHVSEIIQQLKQKHALVLDRDSISSALIKKVNAGKLVIKTAPNTFAIQKEASDDL